MTKKQRFYLSAFLLFGIVVAGAFFYFDRCDAVCVADSIREETQNFSHINTSLFREQLLGAVIIDVRTPEEYVTGHIPRAMLVDLYSDDFKMRIGQLDRDVPYYVYCLNGNRSAGALEVMKTAGFV